MESRIEIKPVCTKRDRFEFIRFPSSLYKGNAFWIPQIEQDEVKMINPATNPAFEFCDVQLWMAYLNGKAVGRIGGIINHRHNAKTGKCFARFTMIDFIDDDAVSGALLQTMEQWARSHGATNIHGPLGFTDMDPEGMLVEGFDELGTIATIYNHSYYPQHLDRAGYRKEVDWVEYEVSPSDTIPSEVERLAKIVMDRYRLHMLHPKNRKELMAYAKEIFHVLNLCYDNLHGFVALTEKQIDQYIAQYFGFIIPEFVPVILNEKGRVVGFGVAMPSLSRAFQKARGRLFPFGIIHVLKAMRKNDRADLYITGVHPDYQNKGVNVLLLSEMHKVFIKRGIEIVESNPELETNAKVQAQWKFYKNRQHKRRRCYVKEIH